MARLAPCFTDGPVPSPAYHALRHPEFQLFFAGQLVSLGGTRRRKVTRSSLDYG